MCDVTFTMQLLTRALYSKYMNELKNGCTTGLWLLSVPSFAVALLWQMYKAPLSFQMSKWRCLLCFQHPKATQPQTKWLIRAVQAHVHCSIAAGVLAGVLGRYAVELLLLRLCMLSKIFAPRARRRGMCGVQKQGVACKCSLPYSAGHAIQFWVLPRTGKPKVTNLDEGRLLAVKQGVVQLHVSAVMPAVTCWARPDCLQC